MRRGRTGPRDLAREPEPRQPGQILDARLHLLDRQVLDVDEVPVCTLDDIELEAVDGEPAGDGRIDGSVPVVIAALLTGPVLGTRVFGGRHVLDVGTAVRLGVHGADLDATWLERWTRDHVIGRIPGGTHDPESSG